MQASLTAWLERLRPLLTEPQRVWVVGGAVRDDLLGRDSLDLDFAVQGEARKTARLVANSLAADYYELDQKRDTGRVLIQHPQAALHTLDFAALRGETIEADLASRDFTLNAMARNLARPEELIDPLRGEADLRGKILRACSPTAIADDPVRALRAVRLAEDFSLRIEPQTLPQVREGRDDLAKVTAERTRDEFMRLLDGPHVPGAIRVLDHLGLLTAVLPELEPLRGLAQPAPHAYPAFEHTLAVVDHLGEVLGVLGATANPEVAADLVLGELSLRLGKYRQELCHHLDRSWSFGRRDRQLLFLAALLHDIGKAATLAPGPEGAVRFIGHETSGGSRALNRAQQLRLSTVEVEHVGRIVAQHMRPESLQASGEVSLRAAYRLFRDCGDAGVDVILLSLADFLGRFDSPPPAKEWAGRIEVARSLLEARFAAPAARLDPPRLIRGDQLAAALGIGPGPEIGRLLEAIREAQASGEVEDEASAIALARRLHFERLAPKGASPPAEN